MRKITSFLLCILCLIASCSLSLAARSPLGIGVVDPVIKPSGPFAHLLLWIQSWQREFEQLLSAWLVGIRQHPENAFWLILLSLAYGVLHAAGPGHGKAVISSYLIANNETLKRGIFLSFLSSLLQAITAIAIVLAVFFLLPARLTETANWLTNASYALIMLLGLWLLIRKTPLLFARKTVAGATSPDKEQRTLREAEKPDTKTHTPHTHTNTAGAECGQKTTGLPLKSTEGKSRSGGEACSSCGGHHMLSPALIGGKIEWKTVLPAIFSIGLRPCSGAVFVMSFALLNGLFVIGSLSVLVMSLGTFVTVSILAALTVHAKRLVLKISNKTDRKFRIQILIEWLAALFIFTTGLLLFASALS